MEVYLEIWIKLLQLALKKMEEKISQMLLNQAQLEEHFQKNVNRKLK